MPISIKNSNEYQQKDYFETTFPDVCSTTVLLNTKAKSTVTQMEDSSYVFDQACCLNKRQNLIRAQTKMAQLHIGEGEMSCLAHVFIYYLVVLLRLESTCHPFWSTSFLLSGFAIVVPEVFSSD